MTERLTKYSKYQKEAIKMIAHEVGSTPFFYEKTGTNHLKVLIEGIQSPLFTSCTPSDRLTLKNFRGEVRKQWKQAQKALTEQPISEEYIDEEVVDVYQYEDLILAIVKPLRAKLEILKQKELALVIKENSVEVTKLYRKSLIDSMLNSLVGHKNRSKYLKSATKRAIRKEFKIHIDFMMPAITFYADLITGEEKEENKQVEKSLVTPQIQVKKVQKEPKPEKQIVIQEQFNIHLLTELSHKDRIMHLKTLSWEVSNQLIDDINEAKHLKKEDDIKAVLKLMQSMNVSLEDINNKLDGNEH